MTGFRVAFATTGATSIGEALISELRNPLLEGVSVAWLLTGGRLDRAQHGLLSVVISLE